MSSRAVRNLSKDELRAKAKKIRREVVRLTDICGSGHYGSAFSIAELLADVIAEEGLGTKLVKIGMPDAYSVLGPPTHLYAHYGLDGVGVAKRVRNA